LAFNGSGTLYGVSGSNAPTGSKNQLYSLNQATAGTTFIMNLADPLSSSIPHAIGFHQVTDRLYHLSGGSSGTFEEINLSTLARTPISLISVFTPFGNAMALTALVQPRKVGADLNGDTKADLVFRNTSNGATAIWLMNGTAIGSASFPGGVPLVWQIAGVGDVNGDGKADVIWRQSTNGTVAVWLMNGGTITGVGFPGTAPTAFEIGGVGDVNGDGKADLVFHNTSNGTTAIWLMNGTAIASAGFPGGVPSDWHLAQVGDVNGDGKADIIWRISPSGSVAVWLMNGFTISTVGFPGSASTEWDIQ
jgi:hypothetical protein